MALTQSAGLVQISSPLCANLKAFVYVRVSVCMCSSMQFRHLFSFA